MATPARVSGKTVIACAVLALCGVAVGVLLGRWTAPPAFVSARPEGQPDRVDLSPVLAAIQDLKQALPASSNEGQARIPASLPTEPTTLNSGDIERLSTAVEKLNEIIERRTRGLSKVGSSDSAWKGPGFPTLGDLHDRVRYWRLSKDPKWREKLADELNEAHGFWTRDEVLDRYGKPTELRSGGASLNLTYLRDDDPAGFVSFQVADGYVHHIQAE
jgi:hypothetical protein